MLMNIVKSSKQRGIGLLELMLSLAIIAILLIMAVRYYKTTSISQKASNTVSIVSGLIGAETSYAVFSTDGKYTTNCEIENLKKLGLPVTLTNNPWGGGKITCSGDTTFTINVDGVDGNACTNIIQPAALAAGASVSTTCAASGSSATMTIKYPAS